MNLLAITPRGFALALLLLLSPGFVRGLQAQTNSAVPFLMIEPDSRAAGMGNTGVAATENAYAIFWNPAGLAAQRGTEAALTHSNWLPEFDAGLFYEYLVAKHHVPGWGTFGAHATYLFLGEHELRDAQNNLLGEFKSYDLALGASYGFNVTKNFALGTGLRVIYSNLAGGVTVGAQETKAGVSAGFDFAGLYTTPAFAGDKAVYKAGFNLANMGPTIQYSDSEQSDPIPTNLRFGHAFTYNLDEFNSLTLTNDFSKMLIRTNADSLSGGGVDYTVDPFYKAIFSAWGPLEVCTEDAQTCAEDPSKITSLSALQQLTMSVGTEYWYNRLFALRAGYFYENPNNGDRQFLTFGAGLRYNIVGVDFSYVYPLAENSPLANTMRFSLLLNFAQ